MKLTHWITFLGFVSVATYGCVPEPLEGFGDAGTNPPNNTSNNTGADMGGGGGDTGGMNNTGAFTPEFVQVAEIMRANCGLAACHGPSPNGQFGFPTGTNATPAEIQSALQVTTPAASGNRLIAPNSSVTSEIFVRINLPAGDPQMMGAMTYGATGTKLQPAQITTVQTWIDGGAVYTQ